jgi:hypothetical protein
MSLLPRTKVRASRRLLDLWRAQAIEAQEPVIGSIVLIMPGTSGEPIYIVLWEDGARSRCQEEHLELARTGA